MLAFSIHIMKVVVGQISVLAPSSDSYNYRSK